MEMEHTVLLSRTVKRPCASKAWIDGCCGNGTPPVLFPGCRENRSSVAVPCCATMPCSDTTKRRRSRKSRNPAFFSRPSGPPCFLRFILGNAEIGKILSTGTSWRDFVLLKCLLLGPFSLAQSPCEGVKGVLTRNQNNHCEIK